MENTTPSSQDLPSFRFDAPNVAGEWKSFAQMFRGYLSSTGSLNKPEAFKIAILLNLMGPQALPVFNSFSFDQEVDLEGVLKKFEDYYSQIKNIVEERYDFWLLTQQPDESIDAFVTKLRRKAEVCRFRDQTDELIRDRLIHGCADRTLVEIFLKEDDLTLDKVLQICQTAESIKTRERITNGESSLTVFTIDDGLNSNPRQVAVKQERRSEGFQEMRPMASISPNDSLPLENGNIGEAVKRGRGRPRIRPIASPQDDGSVKRGRGRPRIHPISQTPMDENGEPIKRGRGRPRIHPIGQEQEDGESNDTPKRGRGRPKKFPRLDDYINSAWTYTPPRMNLCVDAKISSFIYECLWVCHVWFFFVI